MFFTIIIGLFIIFVIYMVYKQHILNKSLKGFTSPPGLPLFKHFFLISSELDCLQNLLNAVTRYGGLLKLEIFYGVPLLMVTDKNLVSYLLGSTTYLEKDKYYQLCENWLGTGLITCKPDKWKKTRKIINPAFHVQLLDKYLDSFENPCKVLIRRLKSEIGPISFDVFQPVSLCTLDILCETVMGTTFNFQENQDAEYIKNIHEITAIILRRLFSPIKRHPLTYMLTKDYWREEKVVKSIRAFTRKVIDARRIKRSTVQSNGSAAPFNDSDETKKKACLIDILLDAEYDNRPMTETEIMNEVQSFLFAGHDTTATCISLCLYCLAQHVNVQNKVLEELGTIFGKDIRSPTSYDLNQMQYLEMVIKETMRLYTPAPWVSRYINEDLSYGDIFIPKGMAVSMFLYGIHRNPDYYPHPETFDPCRFESEIAPFTFIPFGAGSRSCIGQRFAMMEIKYLVCEILRNFKVLPVPGHVPQQVVQIVLKFKNGVMIKLDPR